MTRELEIEVLMQDRCTRKEAENFLQNGTTIYGDLEENFDKYMEEFKNIGFDEEEYNDMVNSLRNMIATGVAPTDWSVVNYEGKNYYISYVN